jgi:hypothetical protein
LGHEELIAIVAVVKWPFGTGGGSKVMISVVTMAYEIWHSWVNHQRIQLNAPIRGWLGHPAGLTKYTRRSAVPVGWPPSGLRLLLETLVSLHFWYIYVMFHSIKLFDK